MPAKRLSVVATDARDGSVVLELKDENGTPYEVHLSSIDAMSLAASLHVSLEEAVNHPVSASWGTPTIGRIQCIDTTTEGKVLLRIFVTDRIYHEYPFEKGTTLANDLLEMMSRVEARNLAKATTPQPGGSGRPN